MTSTAAMTPPAEKGKIEAQAHKLKLQWVMAKDDAERQRVSTEIRKLSGLQPQR